jgi:DNA gyrase/topoisomerase IV subunit B
VWNNGDGIPVEMHKEEGVYVPELIFGHLLTSSNYNDMEKKVCADIDCNQVFAALVTAAARCGMLAEV